MCSIKGPRGVANEVGVLVGLGHETRIIRESSKLARLRPAKPWKGQAA